MAFSFKHYITVQLNFPRPKTRYDRIKSWPLVENTIEGSHHLWAIVGGFLAGPLGDLAGNIFDSDGRVEVKVQAVFDEYISVDANFASVPPSNSIRVQKFDNHFFEKDTVDKAQWEAYASLLKYTDSNGIAAVFQMLEHYFKDRLIVEWDDIFYSEMAPVIFEAIVNTTEVSQFLCSRRI